MTNLISFPFRLDGRGYVATRDDGSDAYMAEEILCLVKTSPGERELTPDYGLSDPLFRSEFPEDELVAKVALYGPPVEIENVSSIFSGGGMMKVKVDFTTRLITDS